MCMRFAETMPLLASTHHICMCSPFRVHFSAAFNVRHIGLSRYCHGGSSVARWHEAPDQVCRQVTWTLTPGPGWYNQMISRVQVGHTSKRLDSYAYYEKVTVFLWMKIQVVNTLTTFQDGTNPRAAAGGPVGPDSDLPPGPPTRATGRVTVLPPVPVRRAA